MNTNAARKILNTRKPVDLVVFKSDGSLLSYNNATQVSVSFRGGFRRFRLNDSGAIRTVSDPLLWSINGEQIDFDTL